jgi:hypothetical protein
MGRLKWVALVATAVTLGVGAAPARADQTVTVAPDNPVPNCWPFGIGSGGASWTPYLASVYQNIPPFELKAGDLLAFDMVSGNDVDIQLEIAMARTTTNGGTTEAEPFQAVVFNPQAPGNPRGDTTAGNFELRFTAEQPFSFPGGGLIIRFSNPGGAFASDTGCMSAGTATAGGASDPAGFFVGRAVNDADGVSPWTTFVTADGVHAFQIRIFDTEPPKTTITKNVKRSKTGRVKFRFKSNEDGATFECKLNSKDIKRRLRQFRDCDSPRKYKKLDEGRYRFKVRAIDAAGNVDSTPAMDRFRVLD